MTSSATIEGLNERFAIPGVAGIVAGHNELAKVQITAAASAEIYLHGAQVTSWRPAGSEEVLFVSAQSRWENGKAIRGGIPVCFPWFRGKGDNPQAPAHGFVRSKSWELLSIVEQPDSVRVTLATESDDASRKWWPHDCRAVLAITVGAQLVLEFTVTNTGSDSFSFEEALHTYHRVADAREIHIAGLDGAAYLDNMDGNREKPQQGDVKLTQPTDNAYLNSTNVVEVIDPILHRRIRTEKRNSQSTIVWNPWQEGARALADLGDDEWHVMACAEAGNIMSNAITLAPGEEHTIIATITVTKD